MQSAKNTIDKIFLDFTYKMDGNNKSEAVDKTKDFFYNNLLPKIDLLLSKHSSNSSIRIDSITIDLEKTALTDLPEKLFAELEEELAKHLPNPLWAKGIPQIGASQEPEDIETLVYFLETGTMPWHHDKHIHPVKLLSAILKKNKALIIHRLRQVFIADEIALERFIMQFTDQQVHEVFTSLITESIHKPILTEWLRFVGAKSSKQIQRTFQFALRHETVKNEVEFLNDFSKALVLPYLNTASAPLPQIVADLQTLSKNYTHPQKEAIDFSKTLEKKYNRVKIKAGSPYIEPKTDDPLPAGKALAKGDKNEESNITSFAVDNAGLVLLFPYLQMFFSEVKLINQDQFINTAAQLKAAQMLQYLVTGSSKTPEHLLALNKALCGIDMAMPCPGTLRLTKVQKQMCETLLNAVINNWPSVRGTSIAGFQQSFVQRNGTLKKDDDNWTLHVERKAFDVLLEQLPWGFSVIKFPWTEHFIHVQW